MHNEPRNLKEALYNTLHRHPDMRLEDIAEEMEMSASYLNRAALPDPEMDGPNASGVRFPLKKLAPLIRVTGDFQPLDFIERSLGRVAVEIPRTDSISCERLADQALEASAEFGTLMHAVLVASKNTDDINPQDRANVIKMGWAAIQSIAQLTTACERRNR